MKVNEWFQLLELQTVSRDDVCAVCMYRLLNIILTTVGSDPEKVKGIRITKDNVYDELRSIDHNASIIWRLLGLQEDNDYFRYYALDMLTDGYYIKPLIGHIYYMLLHGVTYSTLVYSLTNSHHLIQMQRLVCNIDNLKNMELFILLLLII